jgi:hypothetical protein
MMIDECIIIVVRIKYSGEAYGNMSSDPVMLTAVELILSQRVFKLGRDLAKQVQRKITSNHIIIIAQYRNVISLCSVRK